MTSIELATRALRICGCDDALAGDLAEEYAAGRSRRWLWAQTVCAVVQEVTSQLRHHPVLVVRAVLLTWAFSTALSFASHAAGLPRGLLYVVPSAFFVRFQVASVTWIVLLFVGYVLTAWVTATLHSQVRVAAILSVVLLSTPAMAVDPELHRLWANMPEVRFVPYLVLHVVEQVTPRVALIVGGLVLPFLRQGSTRGGSDPTSAPASH